MLYIYRTFPIKIQQYNFTILLCFVIAGEETEAYICLITYKRLYNIKYQRLILNAASLIQSFFLNFSLLEPSPIVALHNLNILKNE